MMLIVATLGLIACTEEPKPPVVVVVPEQEELPTYTIIYLAVGGDTLDEAIERSLANISKSALAPNINLAAQIKWTKGYASNWSNGKGEVCRMMIKGEEGSTDFTTVGDNSYPLYDPDNIADFITWSKRVAPADNYILLLAGHGNGWHPEVGIEATRGTLRDTDLQRYVSLEELCTGIELSGTHFRMIQMISCLMNTMEYITPLSLYADHIMGSCHVSLMLCTEIHWLHMALRSIKSDKESEFVEALGEYMGYIKMEMGLQDLLLEKVDFSITDSRYVARLNESIRSFADVVDGLYDEQESIGKEAFEARYGATMKEVESAVAGAYYYITAYLDAEAMETTEYLRMAFTYDLVDIVRRASRAITCEALATAAAEVEQAARSARRINYTTQLEEIGEVFYGVTLTNGEQWERRGYESAGYEDTLFDKTTGWSRLLKRNNITLQY